MLARRFFQTDPLCCAEKLIGTELVWGKCGGLVDYFRRHKVVRSIPRRLPAAA